MYLHGGMRIKKKEKILRFLCLSVPLPGAAEGRWYQIPRIISTFPGIGKFVWGRRVLEIPKFHKFDGMLLFPSVICWERGG